MLYFCNMYFDCRFRLKSPALIGLFADDLFTIGLENFASSQVLRTEVPIDHVRDQNSPGPHDHNLAPYFSTQTLRPVKKLTRTLYIPQENLASAVYTVT